MPDDSDSPEIRSHRKWFWCVWSVAFSTLTLLEVSRLQRLLEGGFGFIGWLTFWDMETTLPWFVLFVLPVAIWLAQRNGLRKPNVTARDAVSPQVPNRTRSTLMAALIFAVSFGCSWQIGSRTVSFRTQWQDFEVAFADLPPAYHDEYSYLLQARTFLAGRLSWPGMEVRPDLFHQFHVLNEHRTVSRYFPWTGLWIAPFEAAGSPIIGHWLAGAFAAAIFFLALQQVVRPATAFVGGLLIAVSPGIAVFSNLLLAHHPTLLALSIFTWSFFRMMSARQLKFAFIAGTGLTLAMLARPMTAAGYGLPFGMWLAIQLVRHKESRRLAIGFALPLLSGFAFLMLLNHEATGSWKRSAYQEYTDQYTPRHRYGFNNAVGDQPSSGPPDVHEYDQWATNLTPQLAAKNVWQRLLGSLVWSLAVAPVVFGVLLTLPMMLGRTDSSTEDFDRTKLRLLAAAVVTLHLAHIPYWYDGIMHWHYVFETAPLLLMLTAVGLVRCQNTLRRLMGRPLATAWLLVFVATGLLPGWFVFPQYNGMSKTSGAVSELSFPRRRFAEFQQAVQAESIKKPALILIDESQTSVQLSYVINPPDLTGDVLVCRRPASTEELKSAFPGHTLYIFQPPSATSSGGQSGKLTAVP